MANYNGDLDDLGRNIQKIIDNAVNSQNYQKLNQTIRQTVEKAVDVGSEALQRAADIRNQRSAPPSRPKAHQGVVVEKPTATLYSPTGGKTAEGIIRIVGGSLLTGIMFVSMLVSTVVGAVTGAGSWPLTLVTFVGAAAGGGLIAGGVNTLNYISRFKAYCKLLGDRTQCTLEKLAQGVGKSEKFVRKELHKMIGQGLFREGHMDKEETRLITSHETYQLFEQSRLQLEERQRQAEIAKVHASAEAKNAQLQEVLDRGEAFVAEIRRCNDAIPGVEISGKISRMESIVERIFDRAETHPEIIPDLKKLMDYYLPMTVKLLNAYADMDAQPVQGQTIQNSKREIEGTLDTLNLAFEKLMDELFMDTAMDVSSDISVLQTMLAQEGLTEDELTKLKKQQ